MDRRDFKTKTWKSSCHLAPQARCTLARQQLPQPQGCTVAWLRRVLLFLPALSRQTGGLCWPMDVAPATAHAGSATRIAAAILVVPCGLLTCLVVSPGGRRFLSFWRLMLPMVLSYKNFDKRHKGEAEEALQLKREPLHEYWAPRLRESLVRLGGLYIKLGQILGTFSGFLPPKIAEQLRPLCDGVPPRSAAEVRRLIEHGLGSHASAEFHDIEPTPLGAASIGQVHKATLRDGRTVVVKVQYPEVARNFAIDFGCMVLFARVMARSHVQLVRDYQKLFTTELDYKEEAKHLSDMADGLRGVPSVRVPRPIEGLVSRTVLTMEMAEGTTLSACITSYQKFVAAALGVSVEDLIGQFKDKHMRQLLEPSSESQPPRTPVVAVEGKGVEKPVEPKTHTGQAALTDLGRRLFTPQRIAVVGRVALRGHLLLTSAAQTAKCCGVHALNMGTELHNAVVRPALNSMFGVDHFIEYRKLPSSAAPTFHAEDVISQILTAYACQIFELGSFNADPHPGNFLVSSENRVALIDMGCVKKLSNQERSHFACLILSIKHMPPANTAALMLAAGFALKRPHMGALARLTCLHYSHLDLSPVEGMTLKELHGRGYFEIERVPDWLSFLHRATSVLQATAFLLGHFDLRLSDAWESAAVHCLQAQGFLPTPCQLPELKGALKRAAAPGCWERCHPQPQPEEAWAWSIAETRSFVRCTVPAEHRGLLEAKVQEHLLSGRVLLSMRDSDFAELGLPLGPRVLLREVAASLRAQRPLLHRRGSHRHWASGGPLLALRSLCAAQLSTVTWSMA